VKFDRPVILVVLAIVASWLLISCSDQESIFFDIPEGEAGRTLNEFASQSSMGIIYNVEEVGPIITNRIYGEFSFDQGLGLMLEGTSLKYAIDEKSGAIAVWNDESKKTDKNL
jgi:hypothetical protein